MTIIKALSVLSSTALALTACHKTDTTDASAMNTTAATASTNDMTTANDLAPAAPAMSAGQTFANTVAASDAFEIETSKLALTDATVPAIKAFAQKMIEAHTASTAKLTAIAASGTPGITPNAALSADQQTTLDALKASSGKDFDQAYLADQVAGHQKTLDALRSYSTGGDVQQLKMFATTLIPIVTAHLNMAKGLKV